jgi:hypothetical protein
MIISKIYGGLGNQLFQYAIGRSLSLKHGVEYRLDISAMRNYSLREYMLDRYHIETPLADIEDISRFKKTGNGILEKVIRKMAMSGLPTIGGVHYDRYLFDYDPSVEKLDDIYLDGYWQSYRYFEDIEETIRHDLEPRTKPNDKTSELLKYIAGDIVSVSLHIRRGDYVENPKTRRLHGVCGMEYYERAVSLMEKRFEEFTIVVFSDDIEWTRENISFSHETIFVDFNADNPEYDIVLMSECDHNIIANSTLSWWGAWLNENGDKIVIAPSSWTSRHKSSPNLIPEKWIVI